MKTYGLGGLYEADNKQHIPEKIASDKFGSLKKTVTKIQKKRLFCWIYALSCDIITNETAAIESGDYGG